MAWRMNERTKRVNDSTRLDVWFRGLFIPLAKSPRLCFMNSRLVHHLFRHHSEFKHAGSLPHSLSFFLLGVLNEQRAGFPFDLATSA